jgi:hypothetical protein
MCAVFFSQFSFWASMISKVSVLGYEYIFFSSQDLFQHGIHKFYSSRSLLGVARDIMILVSGDLFFGFSSRSSILVASGVMCLNSFVSEWNTTTSAISFSVPVELIASSIVYAVIFLIVYVDHR